MTALGHSATKSETGCFVRFWARHADVAEGEILPRRGLRFRCLLAGPKAGVHGSTPQSPILAHSRQCGRM